MQFDERQYGAEGRARAPWRRLGGLREVFVEGGANANGAHLAGRSPFLFTILV